MASGRFLAVLGPPWLCAWRTQAALPPAGRSVWGAGSPRAFLPRAFLPRLVCLRDPQAVRSWRTWGRTWPRASSKGTKPTWKTHPSSGGCREGGPTRLQHHQCGHSHAHTPRVHTCTSGPSQLEGSSWALSSTWGSPSPLQGPRCPAPPRPAPHCWCSLGCTRSPLRAATEADGEPAVGNPRPCFQPQGSGSDTAGPSTLPAAPVQGRTAALQRGGRQAWTRGQPFCPGHSPPDPPRCPPSPSA